MWSSHYQCWLVKKNTLTWSVMLGKTLWQLTVDHHTWQTQRLENYQHKCYVLRIISLWIYHLAHVIYLLFKWQDLDSWVGHSSIREADSCKKMVPSCATSVSQTQIWAKPGNVRKAPFLPCQCALTVPTSGKRNPAPTLARMSRIGRMKPLGTPFLSASCESDRWVLAMQIGKPPKPWGQKTTQRPSQSPSD